MCTAVSCSFGHHYFGRTLDHTQSYGESVMVVPRNCCLPFRFAGPLLRQYAMIGIGHAAEGFPLYYDGVNEKGLAMAGLNFVGNARYGTPEEGHCNVAQFELLPWVLAQCATVREAAELLVRTHVTDTAFSPAYPPAELHWMLADGKDCAVLEWTAEGMQFYPNPVGVLTNNPPFPMQQFRLYDFMGLTNKMGENRFSEKLDLQAYSRGMGALGLPGDWSSQSRFVRAAFVKFHICGGETEEARVGQLFHLLGTVEVPRGCCEAENGAQMQTVYTACCNAERGIYYYTSGQNRQITAVDLHREDLNGGELLVYPLQIQQQIAFRNGSFTNAES